MVHLLALVLATGWLDSFRTVGIDPPAAPQCLRFDEPLGYSASGTRERGDSVWYVLELDDSGAVVRPLFPEAQRERWAHRSGWTTRGDTVLVRVSDGLAGWDVALWHERDAYRGVATYLTDAIAPGSVPPHQSVRAVIITCPVVRERER